MHPYILPLEKIFASHADAQHAEEAKQYMRNQFEFYGMYTQQRRHLMNSYFTSAGIPPYAEVLKIMEDMWEHPKRDFQYVGIELLAKCKKHFEEDLLESIEFMATNKSWWDSVDQINSMLVAPYFKKFPQKRTPTALEWAESKNMWLQRLSIICQLKRKQETDEALLFRNCKRHMGSQEFFIQKAIGWALREYSTTNPKAVIDFADKHPLAKLSRHEALRLIKKK